MGRVKHGCHLFGVWRLLKTPDSAPSCPQSWSVARTFQGKESKTHNLFSHGRWFGYSQHCVQLCLQRAPRGLKNGLLERVQGICHCIAQRISPWFLLWVSLGGWALVSEVLPISHSGVHVHATVPWVHCLPKAASQHGRTTWTRFCKLII